MEGTRVRPKFRERVAIALSNAEYDESDWGKLSGGKLSRLKLAEAMISDIQNAQRIGPELHSDKAICDCSKSKLVATEARLVDVVIGTAAQTAQTRHLWQLQSSESMPSECKNIDVSRQAKLVESLAKATAEFRASMSDRTSPNGTESASATSSDRLKKAPPSALQLTQTSLEML